MLQFGPCACHVSLCGYKQASQSTCQPRLPAKYLHVLQPISVWAPAVPVCPRSWAGEGVNAHGALEHRKTAKLGGHPFPKQVMGRGDSGVDPRGLKALQWGLGGRRQHHHAAGWGRQSPASCPCAPATLQQPATGRAGLSVSCWSLFGVSQCSRPLPRDPRATAPLTTTSTCFTRSSCLWPAQRACRRESPVQ